MSLTATVLFEMPQFEIASLLEQKLQSSIATYIVSGFATVEGIKSLEPALSAGSASIRAIIVGAGTYQSYLAFDNLIDRGIPFDKLHIHLGHTRLTKPGAFHRFYRYHPMLHSKIYYMEHENGNASAIIGSHNLTGYALTGLNGEAAVLLEGPIDSAEFEKIRKHISVAQDQSVGYRPELKEAYGWWTQQSIEGLSDKVNDLPKEGEGKSTIVILTEADQEDERLVSDGDILYFELPLGIGQIKSLKAEVHLYFFDRLPTSPSEGLQKLDSALSSHKGRIVGIEKNQGGRELLVNWKIENYQHPILMPAESPFRPTPAQDMQQVRVELEQSIYEYYQYFFSPPSLGLIPVIDRNSRLSASEYHEQLLSEEYHKRNPEHLEWFRVTGLEPERMKKKDKKYFEALRKLTPESGSYVMMSFRRHKWK